MRGILAVLLLCLAAVTGCGWRGAQEEIRVQRVGFCQGPSTDNPLGDPLEVEFRQGDRVVARGRVSVGAAFLAEVPVGGVQIFVNGVRKGAVAEGVAADGPYHSPGPDEITYIASAEGCPDRAHL